MRALLLFVASAGCLGYIPVAPGTFGSVAGIPLFWAFDRLRQASVPGYLAAVVGLVAVACWVAGRAERLLRAHDSPVIVIDEVVGYVAATLFLPPTWGHAIVAFLIFRLLDIVKPFPASYVDRRLPGGPGVVFDDVVAGLYANVATRLVFLFERGAISG